MIRSVCGILMLELQRKNSDTHNNYRVFVVRNLLALVRTVVDSPSVEGVVICMAYKKRQRPKAHCGQSD